MFTLAASFGTWLWFIAAALLILIEVLSPGIYMLWLGFAALLVGIISLFVIWDWQWQCAAFVFFAAAAFPLWRRLGRQTASPTDQPFLNRRAEALVGRVVTLEKPIVDGNGTIRIDDTVWRVRGPDGPTGARIKVLRAEGATLYVGAAEVD